MADQADKPRPISRRRELAEVFLKLGVIGFGGPAAHIAMIQRECVERRRWLSHERFLDVISVTNLIPGPNSTELAIHLGYIRAGFLGLIIAGVCFIGPAVLLTAGIAWAYHAYSDLDFMKPIMLGIKPAVLAVIVAAVWKLARQALRTPPLIHIAVCVAIATALIHHEVFVLLVGGLAGMLYVRSIDWGPPSGRGKRRRRRPPARSKIMFFAILTHACAARPVAAATLVLATAATTAAATMDLWGIAMFFSKVGAVLYGSGYLLFAFLESDLVAAGVLTRAQLTGAVAIGQFTPGPLLSTATFIGYQISGFAGAVVATIAIFLPSFVLVAVLAPVLPLLRKSRWAAAFLDAINAAAVALMTVVFVDLLRSILFLEGTTFTPDWRGCLIFAGAAFAVIRLKVNSAWIILAGAGAGYLLWGLSPAA